MAWVIDGATDLHEDAVLPGDSDVEWLVDVIGASLTRAGMESYRGSGSTLLESVAAEVAQRQTAYGFPAGRVPPACSIALFVDQGPTYEITRIGDATAVVTGRDPVTLATDYFDRREATAVRAREADPARVIAAMHERRLHTMTASRSSPGTRDDGCNHTGSLASGGPAIGFCSASTASPDWSPTTGSTSGGPMWPPMRASADWRTWRS